MKNRAHPRDVLALDIGGAAIKAADGRGWTHAESFAMWREPALLTTVLTRIVRDVAPERIVATMTGEIADCFASRAAGVAHIVAATESAAAAADRVPSYYRIDGSFVSADDARRDPLAVSATNWHAMARFAAALVPGERAFLVDVGSTTTDIVPLSGGLPVPLARDDAGRMLTGELVYSGIERTPVATIVRRLPHGPFRRPVAAERFADTRDAWVLLGGLAENSETRDTADGGPLTRAAARRRLARSLLVEEADFSIVDAERAAAWVVAGQNRLIARALRRVAVAVGWVPDAVVFSGHGESLARGAIDVTGWKSATVSLQGRLGAAVSRCAPAHALAWIAEGGLP